MGRIKKNKLNDEEEKMKKEKHEKVTFTIDRPLHEKLKRLQAKLDSQEKISCKSFLIRKALKMLLDAG